jgi:DNA-binding NtrC family response regulator
MDIPALAGYFIERFCKHNNLGVKTVSRQAMDSLLSYSWPGNIRELQYLVERTVLLTPGDTINEFTLPNVAAIPVQATTTPGVKTIREMEIDHIKAVLHLCNGKIYGPGGAAEMLKIPYSTLISRIKKLGIKIEKTYR